MDAPATEPFWTDTHMVDLLEGTICWSVELAGSADPRLQIPTCPGWDAGKLWKHLGMVHRWAAETVATRATERIERSTIDMRLPEGDRWAPWLAEGGDLLLAALHDADPDDEVWAWGPDQHVRWWTRRQLHETLIHNTDASLALGERPDLDPEVASDCLDELFDNHGARRDRQRPGGLSATIHLHATDGELGPRGEWMVTVGPDGLAYTHDHGKGDVAVRAPMTDLLLVVYRRLSLEQADAETFGDAATWDAFLDEVTLG